MGGLLSRQRENDDQEVMSFSKFKRTYTDQDASDYLRYLTTQQEKNPNDLTIGMRIISCIMQSYNARNHGAVVSALDKELYHIINKQHDELAAGSDENLYTNIWLYMSFNMRFYMILQPIIPFLSSKNLLRIMTWYKKCSVKLEGYCFSFMEYIKPEEKIIKMMADEEASDDLLIEYLASLPNAVVYKIMSLATVIDKKVDIGVGEEYRKVLQNIVTSDYVGTEKDAWVFLMLFPHCINNKTFFTIINNTDSISLAGIHDSCPYLGNDNKNKGAVIKLINRLIEYSDQNKAALVGAALAKLLEGACNLITNEEDVIAKCLNFAIEHSLHNLLDRACEHSHGCIEKIIKSLSLDTIKQWLHLAITNEKCNAVEAIIFYADRDVLKKTLTLEITKECLRILDKDKAHIGANILLYRIDDKLIEALDLDTIKTCIGLGIRWKNNDLIDHVFRISVKNALLGKDVIKYYLDYAIKYSSSGVIGPIFKHSSKTDSVQSLDFDKVQKCLGVAISKKDGDAVCSIMLFANSDLLKENLTTEMIKQCLEVVANSEKHKDVYELLSKVGKHDAKDLDKIKQCIEIGIEVYKSNLYEIPLDIQTSEKYNEMLKQHSEGVQVLHEDHGSCFNEEQNTGDDNTHFEDKLLS